MRISEISSEARQFAERRIGIEIEVEQVSSARWLESCSLWQIVADGSLREQGGEFVSIPLTMEALPVAINTFYENAISIGYNASVRTSTHVHVNMQQQTLTQVGAVCAVYSIVEPILFDMLGRDRDECTYCVPWYRARAQAIGLRRLVGVRSPSRARESLHTGFCKYTALNVAALSRFGTIEFRAAPTFESADELSSWIQTLITLVDVGIKYKTAANVVKKADQDLKGLLQEVFPSLEASHIEDWATLVYEYDSISVASSIVRTRASEATTVNADSPRGAGIWSTYRPEVTQTAPAPAPPPPVASVVHETWDSISASANPFEPPVLGTREGGGSYMATLREDRAERYLEELALSRADAARVNRYLESAPTTIINRRRG